MACLRDPARIHGTEYKSETIGTRCKGYIYSHDAALCVRFVQPRDKCEVGARLELYSSMSGCRDDDIMYPNLVPLINRFALRQKEDQLVA